MQLQQYIPSDALKPFIRSFLFLESDREMQNLVLPDTSLTIALRYRGNVSAIEHGIEKSFPNAVISGIRRTSRYVYYSSHSANLLILFKPGGAAAFFHDPIHELFEQSIAVNFLSKNFNWNFICEQLAEAKNHTERVALIEKALISRLLYANPDPLISMAIQRITANTGLVAIRDLTKELYISQDVFEKRFRKIVGTSPKHFASVIRLKQTINTYIPAKSLTDVAYNAGYYDQSHFIKDFKTFTGKTPKQFFSDGGYW